MNGPMTITRIYTGADGVTHFDDFEIPLVEQGQIGALSERLAATGIIFRETPGDYDYDWHPAPCRQYILMLEGTVEIEVGDGEVTVRTRNRIAATAPVMSSGTGVEALKTRVEVYDGRISMGVTAADEWATRIWIPFPS